MPLHEPIKVMEDPSSLIDANKISYDKQAAAALAKKLRDVKRRLAKIKRLEEQK